MKHITICAIVLLSALLTSCNDVPTPEPEDTSAQSTAVEYIEQTGSVSAETEPETSTGAEAPDAEPEPLSLDNLRARIISDDIEFGVSPTAIAEKLVYYLGRLGYAEIGKPEMVRWYSYDRLADGLTLWYTIWSVTLDGEETELSAVTVASDKSQRLSELFFTDGETDGDHIRIEMLAGIANSDPRFEGRFDASEPQSDSIVEVINISKLGSALIDEKYPDEKPKFYNSFIDGDGMLNCVYYTLEDYGLEPVCTLVIDPDKQEAVRISDPVEAPPQYSNTDYTELDSPDSRFTALRDESSDLYIRDNETKETSLIAKANLVDDLQTYRNPMIWRFIGDRLFYNIYGYEYYAGLGVYDCETGENRVYRVHSPFAEKDGVIYTKTWYTMPFNIFALTFEDGEAIETPLFAEDELAEYPIEQFDFDPETGLTAMLDDRSGSTTMPLYIYSISGSSAEPVTSIELDSRLCKPQYIRFYGDRLMISCSPFAECDDYVYLIRLDQIMSQSGGNQSPSVLISSTQASP